MAQLPFMWASNGLMTSTWGSCAIYVHTAVVICLNVLSKYLARNFNEEHDETWVDINPHTHANYVHQRASNDSSFYLT